MAVSQSMSLYLVRRKLVAGERRPLIYQTGALGFHRRPVTTLPALLPDDTPERVFTQPQEKRVPVVGECDV